MNTETSLISKQVRYKQWADDIRDCNARPKGMTVGVWCKNHGINLNTYYWRLNALRRACIDMLPEYDQKDNAEATPRFIELKAIGNSNLDNPIPPSVIIRVGNSSIEIREGISDSFLARLIGTVANV